MIRTFILKVLESRSALLDSSEIQIYKMGKIFQLSKVANQYQCIVETFIQIKIKGKIASGTSYDIAASSDGNSWKETNRNVGTETRIKTVIEISTSTGARQRKHDSSKSARHKKGFLAETLRQAQGDIDKLRVKSAALLIFADLCQKKNHSIFWKR